VILGDEVEKRRDGKLLSRFLSGALPPPSPPAGPVFCLFFSGVLDVCLCFARARVIRGFLKDAFIKKKKSPLSLLLRVLGFCLVCLAFCLDCLAFCLVCLAL